jgi:hypothetical protein
MDLLERDLNKWVQVYLYNEKQRINRGMAFGRQMAEGLEREEATGDPALDLIMERLPKFEIMDKPIYATLKNGKNSVPLLAKPDTMKANMTAFKEYKTGQTSWTKKKVDESGQITFYATTMFLIKGKIPNDIELVYVPTAKDPDPDLMGRIGVTGEIYRYPTQRSMSQIINMMVRMKKAWETIQKITEQELL